MNGYIEILLCLVAMIALIEFVQGLFTRQPAEDEDL